MSELHELPALLAIGLGSGVMGGLLGFGGSVLMIPLLTSFMHRDQHLAQAAAMVVNAIIAAPALIRHHRAGAVRWRLVGRMLPFAVVAIAAGVVIGNQIDGVILRRGFGLFLAYVVIFDIVKIIWRHRVHPPPHPPHASMSVPRSGAVGTSVGLLAGVLGIGGGPVAVPLIQWICHRSLREAIGASTALMCVTSVIGAVLKNVSIEGMTDAAGASLGLRLDDSLLIAAGIAPTAIIGAWIGASITHRAPVRWVSAALIVVLGASSASMLLG